MSIVSGHPRRFPRLSFAPLAFAALLLLTLAPAASAHHLTASGAERYVLSLLNGQRKAVGVRPLRIDARLMDLAGDRSLDMVNRLYKSHVTPEGLDVGDMLTNRGITWYRWGETIAWNSYPLDDSATSAARQWRNSPGHYAIISNAEYNYAGVGVAIDSLTGEKVWTAVLIKGPDRTGAWARMHSPSKLSNGSFKFSWYGADVLLSSLTSGRRDYTVQRRVDSKTWSTVASNTTSTYRTEWLTKGHLYEYQVRLRDKAGNAGPWSPAVGIRP